MKRVMASHARSADRREDSEISKETPELPQSSTSNTKDTERTGQDHDGDNVPSPFAEPQLDCRSPGEGDHRDTGQSEHDPHGVEGDVVRVDGARGKVERAVEAGQGAREADEHFTEWRMHLWWHRA